MFEALKKASPPWLGGLGICVLLVALRWNSLDAPLVRDEGEYAYAAQLLGHGQLPYEHSFLQKPPMVAYTYALASTLAPNTFWFPRVLAGLFALLAACLLGWIARLEFGPGLALPAMWLVTPMLLFPGLWQFTANTETFMLVPLLGTVAVYVVSRAGRAAGVRPSPGAAMPADKVVSQCSNELGGSELAAPGDGRTPAQWSSVVSARCTRPAAWFWAGLLGATTLWYKYTALPVLALLFSVWAFEELRDRALRLPSIGPDPRSPIPRLWTLDFRLWTICGAVVASCVILAPFLARDGGKRLWECTVVFNRYYTGLAGFGTAALWQTLQLLLADWWILFLLPAILVVRRRRRVWFWIGMFLAAWASTAGSPHGHYYLVVMPFWALLAAVAIDDLASLCAAELKWSHAALRRAFTAIVLVLLCLPDLPWVACAKQEFAAVKAGGGNPFLESQAVARRVAELTSPNDYVFVAGSEPQILCYAKRLSPSRFVIAYPLMIPTPLAEGYQREAVQDLERHPPAVIVFARSGTSWLRQERSPPAFLEYLQKLLADHYERVGGWVADPQSSRWQEPLSDQDLANASLVLFRRKNS